MIIVSSNVLLHKLNQYMVNTTSFSKNKKWPFYLTVLVTFLILKYSFTLADNENLFFLLWPTNKIVIYFTSSPSQFINEKGYFFENLNIIIDKSCSGYNFWLILFLMISSLVPKYLKTNYSKLIVLPGLLLISYMITVFVNSSRIVFSILLQNLLPDNFENQYTWLHQTEGTFVYLLYLLIIYSGCDFVLKKLPQYNEKSPQS